MVIEESQGGVVSTKGGGKTESTKSRENKEKVSTILDQKEVDEGRLRQITPWRTEKLR